MRPYQRAVYGLQEKVTEVERKILFRIDSVLREREFQLVSRSYGESGAPFRADAHPVNARRDRQCPIRLYGDLETHVMEGGNEGLVELKQGLSSRSDYQPLDARSGSGKKGRRARHKPSRVIEDTAPGSVRAHKIRVTPWARTSGPVLNFA
jgi:hypothetical protein